MTEEQVWGNTEDRQYLFKVAREKARRAADAESARILTEKAAASPVQPGQLWRARRTGKIVEITRVRHSPVPASGSDVHWRQRGTKGSLRVCQMKRFLTAYDPVSDDPTR